MLLKVHALIGRYYLKNTIINDEECDVASAVSQAKGKGARLDSSLDHVLGIDETPLG